MKLCVGCRNETETDCGVCPECQEFANRINAHLSEVAMRDAEAKGMLYRNPAPHAAAPACAPNVISVKI